MAKASGGRLKMFFGAAALILLVIAGWIYQLEKGREPVVSALSISAAPAAVPSAEPPALPVVLASPAPAASAVPAAPVAVSRPEDAAKLRVLDEIMASRNDNDPRLDHDFNGLTPGAKALFQVRYRELAAEKRNERGTIVFLLGRNLSEGGDFEFLKQVLTESPCQSLGDCQHGASPTQGQDLHHESGDEVTLAYPQLVALKAIEAFLATPEASRDAQRAAAAYRDLEAARESSARLVASKAAELLQHFPKR